MGGIGSGRYKDSEERPESERMVTYGFRLSMRKKEWLTRAYGPDLTEMFKKYADELILRSIMEKDFKLKK